MNFPAVIVATLIPIVIGFVWYNPKIGFGKAWMSASGMTEEKARGANMFLVFGLTILFSFMVAVIMNVLVIHQLHFGSILKFQADSADPNSESSILLKNLMEKYGHDHRTFKHGAFHATIASLFIVLPVFGINALFERRSFKYVAINVGYWVLSFALMGGVISQWV